MPTDTLRPPSCTPDTRRAAIARLKAEPFDVLILGGGINGAGIARDLALRSRSAGAPLSVALVEQRHFGSGTSGKNSQLIHGGLRYLKHLQFRLVREALHERAVLLRLAPHLVEPQPFLIPLYGQFARLQYGCGLWLYDLLAGRANIGRRGALARADVERIEPGLASGGLTCAATFYDCRVHSARFVLANVWDAVRNGAAAANYVRAEDWQRDRRGWTVRLTDTLTGERFQARARKLIDTTGPWSRAGSLRLVRGSHIVIPRVNASEYAIAHFERLGRIVFVIPWGEQGEYSLVGTTDVDHEGGPDDVAISPQEVDYLAGTVKALFRAADPTPVSAFSSLRPLLPDPSRSPTRASREHRIWNSAEGILHVAGGKYTTYRLMSEQAADLAARELAPKLVDVHPTARQPLDGHSAEALGRLAADSDRLAERHGLAPQEISSALKHYGADTPALLACLPASPPPGLTRLEAARAVFAVRHEMAQRLADLLFVSCYRGYEQQWDRARLAPYARVMGGLLGWEPPQMELEIDFVLCLASVPQP